MQDMNGRFSTPTADGASSRSRDRASKNASSVSKIDLSGEEVVQLLHGVLESIRNANNPPADRVTVDDLD